jgi:hypothetical protein
MIGDGRQASGLRTGACGAGACARAVVVGIVSAEVGA